MIILICNGIESEDAMLEGAGGVRQNKQRQSYLTSRKLAITCSRCIASHLEWMLQKKNSCLFTGKSVQHKSEVLL